MRHPLSDIFIFHCYQSVPQSVNSGGPNRFPWEFFEHDDFLTEYYIFDHTDYFKMLRQFGN